MPLRAAQGSGAVEGAERVHSGQRKVGSHPESRVAAGKFSRFGGRLGLNPTGRESRAKRSGAGWGGEREGGEAGKGGLVGVGGEGWRRTKSCRPGR